MTDRAKERYELVTRRLQEVLGGDIIKNILAEGGTPKCYWGQSFQSVVGNSRVLTGVVGTAPTGRRSYSSNTELIATNKCFALSSYRIFCAFDKDR